MIVTLVEDGEKTVRILVEFKDDASATKAFKALDKRWFGGKVSYVFYVTKKCYGYNTTWAHCVFALSTGRQRLWKGQSLSVLG